MNLIKVFITGFVGGLVVWGYHGLVHGLIMFKTYEKYEIFKKDANYICFPILSIIIAFFAALLFSKTRNSWAEGLKGGVTYGFFVGLIFFFQQFHLTLIFEGFPYFLSWCWGGIELIGWVVFGAVAGLLIKK